MILFFGFALVLGVMHETRIFGKCLVVLIREVKHEYAEVKAVVLEVKKEIDAPPPIHNVDTKQATNVGTASGDQHSE